MCGMSGALVKDQVGNIQEAYYSQDSSEVDEASSNRIRDERHIKLIRVIRASVVPALLSLFDTPTV